MDIFDIIANRSGVHVTRRGGSYEYSHSMFWIKNKKIRYTHVYPRLAIIKRGTRGFTLHGHVGEKKKKTSLKY